MVFHCWTASQMSTWKSRAGQPARTAQATAFNPTMCCLCRTLSLEVEARYHLELALEHCVDEDEVQARFDKSAKELVIRAPIKYD